MEAYNEAQKPDTSFSNFAGYYCYTIASWPWPILQWAIPKRGKISGVGGGVDAVFGRLDVGYAGGTVFHNLLHMGSDRRLPLGKTDK